MPAWPATLPDFVLEAGFQESFPDQSIESPVDAGPAKVRRRFTASIRTFRMTIQMTEAQANIMDEFYEDTLAGGSLSFDWVHPRTRAFRTFRFRKPPPSYTKRGEAVFCAFVLETVP